MSIRGDIKRILREENKLPVRLIRRIRHIEDRFNYRMKTYYKPDSICKFENGEELLDVAVEYTISDLYWETFSDIPDNSKEWRDIYIKIENYLKEKYGDKVIEYYHTNCGN